LSAVSMRRVHQLAKQGRRFISHCLVEPTIIERQSGEELLRRRWMILREWLKPTSPIRHLALLLPGIPLVWMTSFRLSKFKSRSMSRLSTFIKDVFAIFVERMCTLIAQMNTCLQRLGSEAFKLPELPGGRLTKPRCFYILFATTGHVCW
jgi:hypothetical protein